MFPTVANAQKKRVKGMAGEAATWRRGDVTGRGDYVLCVLWTVVVLEIEF